MKKMLTFIVLALSLFSVNLMADGLMTTELKTCTNLNQIAAPVLVVQVGDVNSLKTTDNKLRSLTLTKSDNSIKPLSNSKFMVALSTIDNQMVENPYASVSFAHKAI